MTDGLAMSVPGLDFESTLEQRDHSWGDSISTTSLPNETFDITSWFEVPDVPGKKPLEFTGLIHGQITIPLQTIPGIMGNPGQFMESVREVSVPVSFELLASDDPREAAWETMNREIVRTWRTIFLGSAVLLLGSVGIFALLCVLNRKLGLDVPTLRW